MAKIVVAFRDSQAGEQIAGMLRESGYEVMRICSSGNEVKRLFRTFQDGILISGYRFPDGTVDQIADDLSDHIQILCIAKPEYLARISSSRVFRLSPPVKRSVLAAWCDMLVQLHYQTLPHRDDSDKDLITQAKQKLMKEHGMSEYEAHHHLQHLSMRLGLRMVQVAEQILQNQTD